MEEYILKHAEEGYVKAVDIKPTAITFTYTLYRDEAKRFSGSESWNVVGKLAGLEVEPPIRYYIKNKGHGTYLYINSDPEDLKIMFQWVDIENINEAMSFKCKEDANSVRAALVLLGVMYQEDWLEIEEV